MDAFGAKKMDRSIDRPKSKRSFFYVMMMMRKTGVKDSLTQKQREFARRDFDPKMDLLLLLPALHRNDPVGDCFAEILS